MTAVLEAILDVTTEAILDVMMEAILDVMMDDSFFVAPACAGKIVIDLNHAQRELARKRGLKVLALPDFEDRMKDQAREKIEEYVARVAPPMARFSLGKGTAVGVIVKETPMGVRVRLKKGNTIFRKFKKHNVRMYSAGIILKN